MWCKCTPSFNDQCVAYVPHLSMMCIWCKCTPSFRHIGNLYRNELKRSLLGNILPESSQLAEPLLTDPCLKSGIGVRKLISTLQKRKEREREQVGNEESNTLPKSTQELKKPPPHLSVRMCWCAARKHCFWTGVFCLTCCKCLFGVVVFFGECVLLCCKCVLSLNRQLV